MFDWSSRGQLCISSQDKRAIHPVNFFNSGLNHDSLNRKLIRVDEIPKPKQYQLESNHKVLLDISALMIHRLNAGYKLD